jgi:DNA-binding HxlR family transcriptional regulator
MATWKIRNAAACESAVTRAEGARKAIDGRWKLMILSHLFGQPVMGFSALARAIPNASQKMLIQSSASSKMTGS